MARDVYESGDFRNLKIHLIQKRDCDPRTYNLPTASEIAALIVRDFHTQDGKRDIIVQTCSGKVERIDELHPSYLPLQYPLLFANGEDGFSNQVKHSRSSNPDSRKKSKLTIKEFFAFRLQDRPNEKSLILHSSVDGYTMFESQRLKYFRYNQKQRRFDLYKGLNNAILRRERSRASTGKQIILPSTFIGGARYMIQNYQDAMVICKWAGYPDIFLTFTCNPNWPELKRFVGARGLKIEDCLDVVARIFKMKLRNLMKDLKSGNVVGKLKAGTLLMYYSNSGTILNFLIC